MYNAHVYVVLRTSDDNLQAGEQIERTSASGFAIIP